MIEKLAAMLERVTYQLSEHDEHLELCRQASILIEDYILYTRKQRENEKPVGICPSCGEEVFISREGDYGPVWICPRDLSSTNKYWEASEVTEEQMKEDGIYSFCYEDHGGWCGDHMPLHGSCYDKGNF